MSPECGTRDLREVSTCLLLHFLTPSLSQLSTSCLPPVGSTPQLCSSLLCSEDEDREQRFSCVLWSLLQKCWGPGCAVPLAGTYRFPGTCWQKPSSSPSENSTALPWRQGHIAHLRSWPAVPACSFPAESNKLTAAPGELMYAEGCRDPAGP